MGAEFNWSTFGSGLLLILFFDQFLPGDAGLTASDGYKIGVFLGSFIGGLILVVLAFCLVYKIWLKKLLLDYKQARGWYYSNGKVTSDGHYIKKPPPPRPPPTAVYGQKYEDSEGYRHGAEPRILDFEVNRIDSTADPRQWRPKSMDRRGGEMYTDRGGLTTERVIPVRGSPIRAASPSQRSQYETYKTDVDQFTRNIPASGSPRFEGIVEGVLRRGDDESDYRIQSATAGRYDGREVGGRSPIRQIDGVIELDDGNRRAHSPVLASVPLGATVLSYESRYHQRVTSSPKRDKAAYIGSSV